MLTHGSLFSGAGGMDIGFERAGIRTVYAIEILRGRDVTTVDPAELPDTDIISGGPVCRNTSRAALRSGQRTNESLWPHMLRIVAAKKPAWVVVEQPASVERKVILGWVADLERCGYGVAGRIIDSKHWLPQQRARWYLIGRLGGAGLELWNQLYPDGLGMEGPHLRRGEGVRFDGNCADCMRGGVFARVSQRKFALMGAGNAVSIPVATWIAERIKQVISDTKGETDD